jgi:uncharacterized membrane protein YfcA
VILSSPWQTAAVSSTEIIVIVAVLFGAATVHMVAGFAFALLAMPLLTLVLPVEEAVVIMTLLALLSNWWQAVAQRHHAVRPIARRMIIGSYLGMPLGLVILNVMDDRPLRIALGIGVVVATIVLLTDISLQHVGPGLDYSTGFMSGVLNTSIGTNGPPLVFDLQSRRLAPDAFRGTMFVVFAIGNAFSVVLFVLDGKVTHDGLIGAAVGFPGWLAGALLGRALRPRVPVEQFRRLVLTLLFGTAITAIVAAL